jgi:pseudaminic acid synthase
MSALRIGARAVGVGHPVYIVAELSANHDQSLDRAKDVVRAAAAAGADAVKLQTYTPDTMTLASDAEPFRIRGTIWDGRLLHDLYREAQTPWEWHAPLQALAHELGLDFFSTPFDASAVEYLEALSVPVYKVASFEVVDIPLLRRIAATGKPVIMSTGMATLDEVSEAVEALRTGGAAEIALLKCTSAYPATAEEMDLRTIPDMAARFGVPIGLSDHTMDVTVPVTAVALGACVVEKHLTLSRQHTGPDSAFSLEPQEFGEMVRAVRTAERALGRIRYGADARERGSLRFRRSLFVSADLKAGDLFTAANVRCIRPADGLHPRHLDAVIGRRAARDLRSGTPLSWDAVAPE